MGVVRILINYSEKITKNFKSGINCRQALIHDCKKPTTSMGTMFKVKISFIPQRT